MWNVNGLKPLIPWHHVVTGKTQEDSCWLKHEKGRFSFLRGMKWKSPHAVTNTFSMSAHIMAAWNLPRASRATWRFYCNLSLLIRIFLLFLLPAKNRCPLILFHLLYSIFRDGWRWVSDCAAWIFKWAFNPQLPLCFQIYLYMTHSASYISWIMKPFIF